MGILQRLFGTKQEAVENGFLDHGVLPDHGRVAHMLQRPPSYSLIAIPGDVSEEITAFLSACKYELRRTGSFSGEFADVYEGLGQPTGPDNSIVQKAWYQAAGHTILLDPEMVLVTETAQLSQMADRADGAVKVAIWERVSESVAMLELGPQGVNRQTWYCQGEPTEDAIDVYTEIVKQPDSDGLKATLATYGLHEEAVFGRVNATVVELQE